jgi:hypothetical protein
MNGERSLQLSVLFINISHKQVPLLAAYISRSIFKSVFNTQSLLTHAPDWDQFCFVSAEGPLFGAGGTKLIPV